MNLMSKLAAVVFLLAFGWALGRTIIPAIGQSTNGFIAYYTASHLLTEGRLGPQSYEIDWFRRESEALTDPPVAEVMIYNLPTFSLITLPLVGFSPQTARDIWIGLNLLFLLLSIYLIAVALDQLPNQTLFERPSKQTFGLLLAAFTLLFPPTAANFRVGQAYIFLLLLFSLTLWGLITEQAWLIGLSLGLAFVLKATGWPLWLLLLLERRWKALGWGLGTIIAVALLSLPWIGLSIWQAFPQATWEATHSPLVTVTAYQTTFSFLNHLFRFDPVINPQPLVHQPGLIDPVNLLITFGTILLTLWYSRRGPTHLVFAALMSLTVVVSPVAEEHNFVLLLLPIAIVSYHIITRPFNLIDWIWLVLACFLLAVPFYYKTPALSLGWSALLAYPRLYGGWLLWALVVRHILPAEAAGKPQVVSPL